MTSLSLSVGNLRFVRSKDGWLAGVCDGLGKRLDVETWILRALFIFAFVFYGAGLLIYLILAVSLPREDKIEKAYDKKILGVCLRLSRKLDIEVGIVRAASLFLLFSSFGAAFFIYIGLALVLPKE